MLEQKRWFEHKKQGLSKFLVWIHHHPQYSLEEWSLCSSLKTSFSWNYRSSLIAFGVEIFHSPKHKVLGKTISLYQQTWFLIGFQIGFCKVFVVTLAVFFVRWFLVSLQFSGSHFLGVVSNSNYSSLWKVATSYRSIFGNSIPWPPKGLACYISCNASSNCFLMLLLRTVVILQNKISYRQTKKL
jgi:hypothetical protein